MPLAGAGFFPFVLAGSAFVWSCARVGGSASALALLPVFACSACRAFRLGAFLLSQARAKLARKACARFVGLLSLLSPCPSLRALSKQAAPIKHSVQKADKMRLQRIAQTGAATHPKKKNLIQKRLIPTHTTRHPQPPDAVRPVG